MKYSSFLIGVLVVWVIGWCLLATADISSSETLYMQADTIMNIPRNLIKQVGSLMLILSSSVMYFHPTTRILAFAHAVVNNGIRPFYTIYKGLKQ